MVISFLAPLSRITNSNLFMLFGAHVSITPSITEAPLRAHNLGCEVFQIFSRSPQGGKPPKITEEEIKKFKSECKKYNFREYYIHTPYFINLGSAKNNIYWGSISAIKHDLEVGSKLGVKYVMSHLGSFTDLGQKKGMKKVIEGLKKVFEGYRGKAEFLIEISAGAGKIIGDSFEEIATIIKNLKLKIKNPVGVCFDTAHAFESGYDLRLPKAVKKVLDDFDKIIGLEKLKLIHVNDSKTPLGSHKDRHEHLGLGKIGLEGFKTIVHEKRLKNINMIIETPNTEANDKMNLEVLKKLRMK